MRSVRYLTVYYGVGDGAKGNASAQVVQKESDHRCVETDINYKTAGKQLIIFAAIVFLPSPDG